MSSHRSPTRRQDEALARRAFPSGRLSAARRIVVQAVGSMHGAFTVGALYHRAREIKADIGRGTTYRAVAAMAEAGFLARVGESDGHALYLHCETPGHHHHVVCTSCGATQPADCPLDERALAAAAEAGFVVTGHDLTVYGLCAVCAADPGAR